VKLATVVEIKNDERRMRLTLFRRFFFEDYVFEDYVYFIFSVFG